MVETSPSLFGDDETPLVFAFCDNGERFYFVTDAESMSWINLELAKFAADPEINFSWRDAARRIKEFHPSLSASLQSYLGNFDNG